MTDPSAAATSADDPSVRPAWPNRVAIAVLVAIVLLAVVPGLFSSYEPFAPPPASSENTAVVAEPGQRLFVGWALPVVTGDRDVTLDAVALGELDDGIELAGVWALRYDESPLGSIEVATADTVAEHYALHLLEDVTLVPGARDWYLAFELVLTQPGEATAGPVAVSWRAGDADGAYIDPQTFTLAGGFDALTGGRTCGRADIDVAIAVAGDTVNIAVVPTGLPCAIDTNVEAAVLSGGGFAEMADNPGQPFALRGLVDDGLGLVASVDLPCDGGALEFVVIVQTEDGLVLAEAVQPFDAPPCANGEEPTGRLGPLARG